MPRRFTDPVKHVRRRWYAKRPSRRTVIVGACVTSALVVLTLVIVFAQSGQPNRPVGAPLTSAATTPTVASASIPTQTRSATSPTPSKTRRPSASATQIHTPAPVRPPATLSPTTRRPTTSSPTRRAVTTTPPPKGGYFGLLPIGSWSSLPSDASCSGRVHYSTWEPRPDNAGANHVMPDAQAVHRSLAARPVAGGGSADPRWDSWLLQRVDGHFTGTTDEIFQWAACKWGLSDDLLRAIAVRESTWFQYETYQSGRPVVDWGNGDMMPSGTAGAATYCNMLAGYGHDYQKDFGAGICPQTFSIAGVMSWQSPSWGQMPGNQNGTFPFNRQSTAFALDYLASQLRGCYDGWEYWLKDSGGYAAGDIWGCVGAWYAGDWHSSDANGYISRVRNELANFTWLGADWPGIKPSCDATYGCPGPGHS